MRFHLGLRDGQAGAHRLDAGDDDGLGIDFPQAHADQLAEADVSAAEERADVQADELEHDGHEDDQDQKPDQQARDVPEFCFGKDVHTLLLLCLQHGHQPMARTVGRRLVMLTTRICLPGGMMPKSDITSMRCPANSHMPMGRSSLTVVPVWPICTSSGSSGRGA